VTAATARRIYLDGGAMWVDPLLPLSKLVANYAVALASILAPVLGVVGFRSWKRELTGKTKYNSAHKILLCLYRIRDRVDIIRNPFFDASEYYHTSIMNCDVSLSKNAFRQEAHAYNNRLKPLRELYDEFHLLALEAEALWPSNVRQLFGDVVKQLSKLFITARTYYDREQRDDALENIYKIVVHHDKDDDYKTTLEAHINSVECFFKPYLG
jgi:hypothetical protein